MDAVAVARPGITRALAFLPCVGAALAVIVEPRLVTLSRLKPLLQTAPPCRFLWRRPAVHCSMRHAASGTHFAVPASASTCWEHVMVCRGQSHSYGRRLTASATTTALRWTRSPILQERL